MLLLNSEDKKIIKVSVLELSLLIDLLVCTICRYTCGLNSIVYIFLVGILPFVLLLFIFYPTMDLFKKIKNLSSVEKINLVGFFVLIVYYITAMFILR